MTAPRLLVGVDIGGTFTDLVLADPATGRLTNVKTLTSPHEPARAVLDALREALALVGAAPGDVARFVHATTLPTNLVLERRGARVAFVATEGFGDMFEIGRQHPSGPDRFNLRWERPPALVDRACTVEVPERMGPRGEVWRAIDLAETARRLDAVAAAAPEAFAVCLLHAYADDRHERAVAELLRARFPDVPVSLSSEVWPELREYERAAATALSAYVGPVFATYTAALERELRAVGVTVPLQIMQSSGAVMRVEEAVRRGAYAIESGPAAGVMAAAHLGRSSGRPDLISFDMGGTTAKAGLVLGGRPRLAPEFRVGGRASASGGRESGEPIRIPVVDLAEVGAGGGSIAWVDAGGHLRLGPRSAGADPGPACYDRGGVHPTVTDANVVLGYLGVDSFNGGRITLRADRSHDAIDEHVARPLGLSVADAARGIHALANTSMGAAIRIVTLQRGIDPREHPIVAFGGAGPVHIVHLAALFGIREVVVPPSPGVRSAHGLLLADLAHDAVRTLVHEIDGEAPAALEKAFVALEAHAAEVLAPAAAHGERLVLERAVDLGFAHKFLSTPIPLAPGAVTHEALAQAERDFRDEQRRTFGVESRDRCRIMGVRVHAVVPVTVQPEPVHAPATSTTPVPRGHRPAWFDAAGGFVDTPVHDRSVLAPGHRLVGPAIIEEPDATTICPPGHEVVVDAGANLVIREAP